MKSIITALDTTDASLTAGTNLIFTDSATESDKTAVVSLETRFYSNEINAAPIFLGYLYLRGKVVTGDAIHTQRALSTRILETSGEYLWVAKENQPTLRHDIIELFEAKRETVLGGVIENDFATFRTVEKGHGRLETREVTVSSELKGYSDWPGLEQVFRLERQRSDPRSGKKESEVVYGLTSLSREEASPERLLYLARTHWGIENGLYGRRDVTLHEDRTRLTRGSGRESDGQPE